MNPRTVSPKLFVALLATLALLAPATASAERQRGRDRVESHPAYVPEPDLIEYATDDTEIIEVTLSGAMLRAAGNIVKHEAPEIGELVGNLEAVNAVLLQNWDGPSKPARNLIRDIAEDLDEDWERVVRIRKRDELIYVFIHLDRREEIDGLLVLMQNRDELVFSNLVGHIDLEQVAEIAEYMEIPGIEQVPTSRDPVDVNEEGEEA